MLCLLNLKIRKWDLSFEKNWKKSNKKNIKHHKYWVQKSDACFSFLLTLLRLKTFFCDSWQFLKNTTHALKSLQDVHDVLFIHIVKHSLTGNRAVMNVFITSLLSQDSSSFPGCTQNEITTLIIFPKAESICVCSPPSVVLYETKKKV